MSLYELILTNANNFSWAQLDRAVKEHHLECLAKFVKEKFNDSRSVPELVTLIKEECVAAK